ncbi:MAG: class SAM-dependent methyltransferase [Candidatus Eremiobacteraeota bacterium]|jgi:predicted O-methyltransferase YrrM|nr:class SAM-dependent methyltransferase [Candidatus Eremiobacteraeota bacterium]
MDLNTASADQLRGMLLQLADKLESFQYREGIFPNGHFYSPSPDRKMIEEETAFVAPPPMTIPGIDLQPERQLALLDAFRAYGPDVDFPEHADGLHRFYYQNEYFADADAIALFCMMRHVRPTRIVEVGSGFSSALMLDVNERYFSREIALTFIEPYADRLRHLMRPADAACSTIVERPVQKADPAIFKALAPNDILFIDSSHVVKYGSDLAHLLWNVLPVLAPGVIVHFHDVFYPFEYPPEWLREGRFWNECYLLRAFLMHNPAYRIELFLDYMQRLDGAAIAAVHPIWARCTGGSMWLRKIGA